jgi:hypothetical protein
VEPRGNEAFLSSCCPDLDWGPHILLSIGHLVTFPAVKWLELEADLSLLTIAEVKRTYMHKSTPTYVFLA